MLSNVNVKIIFIPFISEKGVRLLYMIDVKKIPESRYLFCFGCQSPCCQVELKNIIIYYLLLYPVDLVIKSPVLNSVEPWSSLHFQIIGDMMLAKTRG